jgi:hypothetical protein
MALDIQLRYLARIGLGFSEAFSLDFELGQYVRLDSFWEEDESLST